MTTVPTSLRVAQIVCSDAFAGVERYIVTLASGLAADGCDVVVFGGDSRRMRAELQGIAESWHPARSVRDAVVSLLRAGRFDIVHAHMTAAESAVLATRLVNHGRFFVTRHFAARRGASPGGRLIGAAIRHIVDRQLAISDFVAASIDGPSVVVRPGVPVDAEALPDGREPIVLVAQRLEAEKCTEVAIEAWALSGLAAQDWELQIAGSGAQELRLRSLARSLGVASSCRFLGARDDLRQRFRRASILLATRPDEPFGLAVVEAMAAALPVVAAAGGGHLETVATCADARLFPPGDAQGAAHALVDLATDEEARCRYGARLRAVQRERLSDERQVREVLDLYRAP